MPAKCALWKKIKNKESFFQFLRFGIIGVANTFIDLFVLNILVALNGDGTSLRFSGLGIGNKIILGYYPIFKSFSFVCANIFSYFANKIWAFKDTSQKKGLNLKKFSKFFLVSVGGMLVNVSFASLFFYSFDQLIGTQLDLPVLGTVLISQAILATAGGLVGTAFGLLWNFFGYKIFVFKK